MAQVTVERLLKREIVLRGRVSSCLSSQRLAYERFLLLVAQPCRVRHASRRFDCRNATRSRIHAHCRFGVICCLASRINFALFSSISATLSAETPVEISWAQAPRIDPSKTTSGSYP